MKTRTIITISALLVALTSCGSAAQYARDASGQKYHDGIYYEPETTMETVAAETSQEVDALIAKTKNSPIYMKSGEKVDTLFIPDNKITRIALDKNTNTTTVTLYDSYPYDSWYTGAWGAYRPWYYSSFYWGANPWYYGGWYSPYSWGGWYDPWYYGPSWGWYDPWYYGPSWRWGGWYDPW